MDYKKVSILIVGRNAESDLERLFASIKNLKYPKDFLEIVYIDDGSEDKSFEIAKKYVNTAYKFATRQGRARVRNMALKKAKHDLITWIDTDCEIKDPYWIQNMLKHIKGKTIGVAGNQLKPTSGLERIIWYLPGSAIFCKKTFFASWAPTTSSLFVKKPLLDVGGFKENLITAEDLEICWRLGKLGYKFKQIPQAEIIHYFRSSFKKFIKQQYERGYFGGVLAKKYNKSEAILKLTKYSIFIIPTVFIISAIFKFLFYLIILCLLSPLLVFFGLDYLNFFPKILYTYLKNEKSLLGGLKLMVLEYARILSLLAGLIKFGVKDIFGKS